MAVWDLYSKRRKKELGQLTDVLSYDRIPDTLRTQVVQMWDEAIGVPYQRNIIGEADKIQATYQQVVEILRREYGVFKLSNARDPSDNAQARDDLVNWFLKEQDNERVLDAIELTFKVIDKYCGQQNYLNRRRNRELADGVV